MDRSKKQALSVYLNSLNHRDGDLRQSGTASVLVAMGEMREHAGDVILLTKRTHKVQTHKGQISFPGGYWEKEDKSFLKTALRETFEEVGITEERIETIGKLTQVHTHTQTPIVPYVAWVDFPTKFQLSLNEVDSLLYLPLNRLIEQGLEDVDIELENRKFKDEGIYLEGEIVWGATARILKNLRQALLSL